jgi:hypothetical protein
MVQNNQYGNNLVFFLKIKVLWKSHLLVFMLDA